MFYLRFIRFKEMWKKNVKRYTKYTLDFPSHRRKKNKVKKKTDRQIFIDFFEEKRKKNEKIYTQENLKSKKNGNFMFILTILLLLLIMSTF